MSRRPRVLILTPDFPPARGGIQLLVGRIAANLTSMDVRVVALDSSDAGEWDARQPFPVTRAPRRFDHRVSVLGLNVRAVREALRWRPDVVLAAHIVTSPGAALLARRIAVPVVLYLHAKEVGASPRLARFAISHSDVIIAVSRYTRSLALRAGAPQAKLRLVPPGVDVVDAPTDLCRRSTPTVLTIARLEDRHKGHDVVTRALPLIRARVPGTEWIVIGEGPLRRDIERLASAHGLDGAVRLLGSLPDAERDAWLSRSHVFTMPSRLPAGRAAGEGFGIVYLEAALHGLPVVAGNVGGALDAVVDGETGVLVDPTSHVAVADAIADLLLDPDRARRLGDAGRKHARRFAWDEVVPRIEAILLEAAGLAV